MIGLREVKVQMVATDRTPFSKQVAGGYGWSTVTLEPFLGINYLKLVRGLSSVGRGLVEHATACGAI